MEHKKRKYYEFMSQKLASARKSQISEYMDAAREKQQKLQLLRDLEKQEKDILDRINKSQSKVDQASR